MTLAKLHEYEPTIITTATTTEAYLSAASGTATGYKVTATATNGETFTIERLASGEISRTCTAIANIKGCSSGDW